MRMQAENALALQFHRAFGHMRDSAVPILHREGEIARLQGAAHRAPLVLRHLARQNQPLRTARNPRCQHAREHLIRGAGGQGFRAEFRDAGCNRP